MLIRRERILDDIVTAVRGITTVKLASRDFRPIDELLSVQLPAIFVNAGPEDDATFTTELDESELTVEIRAYIEAKQNLSTALNAMIGDVHQALMVDGTRNGLAFDTVRQAITDADEVSLASISRVGALMQYLIRYHRAIESLE